MCQDLKPLYQQLHAYVRTKLAAIYPEVGQSFFRQHLYRFIYIYRLDKVNYAPCNWTFCWKFVLCLINKWKVLGRKFVLKILEDMPYLIFLNPLLLTNIAYIGHLKHFVFVFVIRLQMVANWGFKKTSCLHIFLGTCESFSFYTDPPVSVFPGGAKIGVT